MTVMENDVTIGYRNDDNVTLWEIGPQHFRGLVDTMRCTCFSHSGAWSCRDSSVDGSSIPTLNCISRTVLPQCCLILPWWIHERMMYFWFFHPGDKSYLVCGVDYVWVYYFPFPQLFPQFEFPFGPFFFVRHWFTFNIWWAIL